MQFFNTNDSQHEYTLNPITAVASCRNGADQHLILVGEGSFLKVFEAETSKLRQQCEIFKGQAIHGIAVRELHNDESVQIVIWGGPCLVTLTKQEFKELPKGSCSNIIERSVTASDWILDVAISPNAQNGFAMVTAHNTILHAKLGTHLATFSLEVLPSPSRSILYSAHIVWESSSSLLIAAGTVFGEIIVWKCDLLGNNEVLHIFTGHEGSVFGVNISPPIHFDESTMGRILASCSDDRTIRVWSLVAKTCVNVPLMRETGFGNNDIGSQSEDYKCLATVMAHASRIWRVKFLIEKGSVGLLSFGEDATAQHWSLSLGKRSDSPPQKPIPSEPRANLNHLHTFAFHSGKHIWSTAMYSNAHNKSMIVTGGADGKISMYCIDTSDETRKEVHSFESEGLDLVKCNKFSLSLRPRSSHWDLEDVMQSCSPDTVTNHHIVIDGPETPSEDVAPPDLVDGKPPKKKKPKRAPKDAFNRYGFVTHKKFLATTTFGRVFLGSIDETIAWQEILLPEGSPNGLKSYAVVQGFPELGLGFLAGANGEVYCYDGGTSLRKVASVDFKVADMFKILNPDTNQYELLVTTLGGQIVTLLTLNTSSLDSIAVETSSKYGLPEKFVVTSAGKTKNLLVLGSRSGTLALYATDAVEKPLHIWTPSEASAAESITTIILIPSETQSTSDASYILTTARDSAYCIFAITNAALHLVHRGTPPLGPMIESASFSGPSNDLVLYGFKGKSFIVWNETKQVEIANIECGGAHRSYAYSPMSTSQGGIFVYTKASKLCLHIQRSSSHEVVKPGGHGREIKASAVSADGRIIATGAEDTEIRLWTYSSASASALKCNTVVQKHTTGIQSLLFHYPSPGIGKSYLFSSGGNEEFYIWSLTPIPGFGTGVVCEASVPDVSPDHDLRIMSFDISDLPDSPGYLLISLAYSDSTFKSWSYGPAKRGQGTGKWNLLASGRYTSSCLTQMRHLRIEDGEFYILTAATDGRLVLWNAALPSTTDTAAPPRSKSFLSLSKLKIHQSSIKSLDITTLPTSIGNLIVIATGGDDNALTITVYYVPAIGLPGSPRSFILKSAHAAAVTGLSFLPPKPSSDGNSSKRKVRIVSSSNDQRVKEWDVTLTLPPITGGSGNAELDFDLHITKIGDGFTAIADVGDMSALHGIKDENEAGETGAKVLIVGNGMEVWSIS